MIDSYTQQYITKSEFEPRIKSIRQRLNIIQEQQKKLIEQQNFTKELELIVNNLEDFSSGITLKIDSLDWSGKRDIIRQVVKRIEIGENEISIVYRVDQLTDNSSNKISMQHCCNRTYGSV